MKREMRNSGWFQNQRCIVAYLDDLGERVNELRRLFTLWYTLPHSGHMSAHRNIRTVSFFLSSMVTFGSTRKEE